MLGDSQASEFGTVKVHAISHLTDCIWRSGVPKHYSANLYERLHIQLLKIGYRASNRRDAIEWVIFHHRRLCALRALAGLDEIDELVDESPTIPGRETALLKVSVEVYRLLRKSCFSLLRNVTLADSCMSS